MRPGMVARLRCALFTFVIVLPAVAADPAGARTTSYARTIEDGRGGGRGHRAQSVVKTGFRQLRDPHVVSFAPMHNWTDSRIRAHISSCVLTLTVAHLRRREAEQAGLHPAVREPPATLGGIEESVLLDHDGGNGRPGARRMLTDMTPQQRLAELFDVPRDAPTR